MHKRSLSNLSLSSFTSKKEKDHPPSPTRGSLDFRGSVFDLVKNYNKVAEQGSARDTGRSGGQKKPNKARSTVDFSILRMHKKSSADIRGPSRDKENQRPVSDLPLDPPTNSNFVTEPGALPSSLFSLPQDHLHSGNKRPSVPFKDNSPRITPHSSKSSLRPSLLPPLPIKQSRNSFSSSGSSSSSFSAEELADTEALVKKYTPTEYTSSSQRNFFGQYEPNLTRKPVQGSFGTGSGNGKPKQRPKSAYVPPSASLLSGGFSVASPRKTSYELRRSMEKKQSEEASRPAAGNPSGQNSGRSSKTTGNRGAGLDLEGIDVAFEALLVCFLVSYRSPLYFC